MASLKEIAYRLTPSPFRNYWFPIPDAFSNKPLPVRESNARNLHGYSIPLQNPRESIDVRSWRLALQEAERGYYPFRVKMQRLFMDTIINGHVKACHNRRKDMTLLKEFHICDDKQVTNDSATNFLKTSWFYSLISYIQDAKAYGYSAVQFGDYIDEKFPRLMVIQRDYIVVDYARKLSGDPYYSSIPYQNNGIHFTNPEERDKNGERYNDWIVWATTPSDNGTSSVGFGYLYPVAFYEIFLRNNIGANADYVEVYGQPLRKGRTSKREDDGTGERSRFEQALRTMGANAYILLDTDDDVELVESKGAGKGNEIYDRFEERLEKKISKLILGHADAMDSTPGKLGAPGKGDDAVAKALRDTETTDVRFIEEIMNDQVLPKLRNIVGTSKIPLGLKFQFKNNEEKQEIREREDASNLITTQIAMGMKTAGLKMPAKYFAERTGIPAESLEEENSEELSDEDKEHHEQTVKAIRNSYFHKH